MKLCFFVILFAHISSVITSLHHHHHLHLHLFFCGLVLHYLVLIVNKLCALTPQRFMMSWFMKLIFHLPFTIILYIWCSWQMSFATCRGSGVVFLRTLQRRILISLAGESSLLSGFPNHHFYHHDQCHHLTTYAQFPRNTQFQTNHLKFQLINIMQVYSISFVVHVFYLNGLPRPANVWMWSQSEKPNDEKTILNFCIELNSIYT